MSVDIFFSRNVRPGHSLFVFEHPLLLTQADAPWNDYNTEEGLDNEKAPDDDPAAKPDGDKPEDDDADADAGPAAGPARPQTKNQTQQLRDKYQNTIRLVAHLFHDRGLQAEMRMVAAACRPLLVEYTAMLQTLKTGQAREGSPCFYVGIQILWA